MPAPIPSVDFTILSNGLGLVPPSPAGTVCIFGCTSGGTENEPSGPYRTTDALITAFGYGEGIELACNAIESGVPVIFTKVATDGAGTKTSVTFNGTGTSVMTVSGNPNDQYDVLVTVVRDGTAGTDPEPGFTVSYDGGLTTSRQIRMPANRQYASDAGVTGLTLNFTAAPMVEGDTYTFSTTAPTWAAADVADALAALKASPKNGALVYVAGACSKTESDTILNALGEFVERKKFERLILEAVDQASDETEAEWMTAISTEWSTASNDRLVVGAGAARVSSAITGTKFRRNIGHLALVRAGRRGISRDLGAAADGALCPQYEGTNTTGPLNGVPVDTVYHDEGLNPGLNDNRFMTVTTIEGLTGYYITNPSIMTGPTSDFDLLQLGRVMDEGCRVVNTFFAPKLSTDVRVNPVTGFILERDARALESGCDQALNAALVNPGHASFVQTVVSRVDNILTTKTLTVTVSIVPLGYVKKIDVTITFLNPALVVAA